MDKLLLQEEGTRNTVGQAVSCEYALQGKEADLVIRRVASRAIKILGWSKPMALRSAENWVRAINEGAADFGN